MRKLLPVLNALSLIVILFATTMVIPLAASLHYHDGAHPVFSRALAIAYTGGLLLYLSTRRQRRELRARDGFLLVTLVWTGLALVACLPFLLYAHDVGMRLSMTDAYFEAMSGLTTTGATTFAGLDHLPPSINVWRGTLTWMGGMGILILAVAILPMLGAGGSQVFRAEVPGPMKDERLTPRIAGTAKGLYAIYMGLSALCLLSFRACGVSWYDAYCLMTATIALSGFAVHDAGFVAYSQGSLGVELVAVVFMLVAGISFTLHFQAFRQRRLAPYFGNTETRAYLGVLAVSVILVTLVLLRTGHYGSPWAALRDALFNTVSMATTTGFTSVDYASWPMFAPVLMIVLSCLTATAGSTGGGIKMIRLIVLVKQARREFTYILHPRSIHPITLNGLPVANRVVFSVLAFILVYAASLVVLTLALLFTGLDAATALTAVLGCLNSTGIGLGGVGPGGSFSNLDGLQVWICSFAMLIGRLELFSVLILFTPTYWRK